MTSLINVRVEAFEANAHAPAFASSVYHASVAENNAVGILLTRVEATDADRHGNRIRYRLAENSLAAQSFAVDTWSGVVTAAVSFDREETATVETTVVAEDSGFPSLSTTALLIVTVRDLDDEKQQRGSNFRSLGDDTVVVRATDAGIGHVIVTVRDQDDEQPVFQQERYSFRLAENLPAGTVVGQVAAVDRDTFPFNRIVYSLDPVSDRLFRIDPDTGRLVTRQPLDREEKAFYRAVVAARPPGTDLDVADASSATSGSGSTGVCDVDIAVDDVNDNRPRFEFPVAGDDTIVVRATDAGIGHVIGQVRAGDPDAGVNARLVYRLSTQSVATLLPPSTSLTTDAFRIDAESGRLTTIVDLRGAADDESQTEFILEVIVSDRGTPSLSNSAPLRIVVGSEIVGLRRTNAQEDGAADGWTGGSMAELLSLSGDELTLIVAFVLSAVVVSVCVVVVCAARCGQKRDKRSAGRQQEVAAIGDASIDSPLMMTSLTSDSVMTSDRQVTNHV